MISQELRNGDESWQTWYNGKAYADFLLNHGYKIKFQEIQLSSNQLILPIAFPTVWSYYKKTRIPVPPKFGPVHSGFLGMLAKNTVTEIDLSEFIQKLVNNPRKQSRAVPYVQPSLGKRGVIPHLNYFHQLVEDSSLETIETKSRIIHLPNVGQIIPQLTSEEINTDENSKLIIESYDSKRRYDIRRAIKLDRSVVSLFIDSDEMATEIYKSIMPIHIESSQRTGIGGHTLEYWTGMSKAIRDQGGIDIVSRVFSPTNEVESVVVIHVLGDSAFYQMNSSTLQANKSSSNPLNLHSAILHSAYAGAKFFELGRISETDSNKSKSIFDYKSQFGGQDYPVVNFKAPLLSGL